VVNFVLPLYTTEGYCEVQYTELLLPQNENEEYIIRLIGMIV